MIVPTRRTIALLGVAAPIALLGYLTPYALDALLAANVAVALLAVLDWALCPAPHALRVERHAPETFSVGRTTECTYVWRNGARRTARLAVREVRPAVLGGLLAPRPVTIPGRGAARETHPVVPARRGKEHEGWLAVRSRGPMGLVDRQGRIPLPWTVTVYPAMPASRLKASVAEAVRRKESGLRAIRHLGEGRQFESLREWVPGDDTRHIDWKASARRRKVITRQFEEERRQQVMLVIDAGRLLTAEIHGEARIEFVIRAALWLAFAANYHDDDVGVMVFSDSVHHYVPPQRGRRGLRQVLDALAATQARLVEPDYPAAFRYLAVRNRKRALTVFFTDVIDDLASEALVANVASLRPRHLPLVVTLRNPDLDTIATARPSSVGEAYRKAAAEELLRARNEALAAIRRRGALVLDVQPVQASWSVVDRYLELKRRGAI